MKPISQEEVMREAFRYQDALLAYAYGLVRDWALAQDALQEAYLALMKKWQEYRPEAGLFPWIRQMVRFEALNLLRSRAKERRVEPDELFRLVDLEFEKHLGEATAGRMGEERKALAECMSRLKKDAIDLLLGFYRNSFSSEKLGELHGMSPNAVRLTLSRVRKQLRECLSYRLSLREQRP